MAFDSLKAQAGAANALAPMQIAQHSLFTAKEKIELLHQLKAEVTGASAEGDDLGFSPEEIDAAPLPMCARALPMASAPRQFSREISDGDH